METRHNTSRCLQTETGHGHGSLTTPPPPRALPPPPPPPTEAGEPLGAGSKLGSGEPSQPPCPPGPGTSRGGVCVYVLIFSGPQRRDFVPAVGFPKPPPSPPRVGSPRLHQGGGERQWGPVCPLGGGRPYLSAAGGCLTPPFPPPPPVACSLPSPGGTPANLASAAPACTHSPQPSRLGTNPLFSAALHLTFLRFFGFF